MQTCNFPIPDRKKCLGNTLCQHNLPLFPVYFVVSSQPILAAKYCAACKSKLVQIALVGLVIHPQNSQRDNFTHEPPCFHTNSFGVEITVKSSLTSGFYQKFASIHHSSFIMPAWGLLQRTMAGKTLVNDQLTRFELVCSLNIEQATAKY